MQYLICLVLAVNMSEITAKTYLVKNMTNAAQHTNRLSNMPNQCTRITNISSYAQFVGDRKLQKDGKLRRV